MRVPLNQAMRTAFLAAPMAAASASFAVTAHAGSGSRRAINADVADGRKGAGRSAEGKLKLGARRLEVWKAPNPVIERTRAAPAKRTAACFCRSRRDV
jgi:hypothetical protein